MNDLEKDAILPCFELTGSCGHFSLHKGAGPPESWNTVRTGQTLAVHGSHGVLCHAYGRRHQAQEGRAAQLLATRFLDIYDQRHGQPAPERLESTARAAYEYLATGQELKQDPATGPPGLVAACFTTRGLDWLQAGRGWLFIQQPGGKLIELTTQSDETAEETERSETKQPVPAEWRRSWTPGNDAEQIEAGTVVISAAEGILQIAATEIEALVHAAKGDPRRITTGIRRAVWKHDPELFHGSPSVTVCVVMSADGGLTNQ